MKTITLDEESYQRLKSWKRSPRDSFSRVIKRVVPESGTLGAFLNYVETTVPVDFEADIVMEESVNTRSSEKPDPWI